MNMKLKDRVAIITGAAAGIGLGAAALFLEKALRSPFATSSGESRQGCRRAFQDGTVRGFVTDISKKEQIEAMVAKIVEEFSRIDILVNNAVLHPTRSFTRCPTSSSTGFSTSIFAAIF